MYKQLFKKALNPFYEKIIKRRNIFKYRAFLEESQWWPYEKLKEFQWKELSKLLKHAYENVPYWRKQFERLNIEPSNIKTHDDFRRLPIIEKTDIRANYDSMISENYRGKTWEKSTGGSTGEPLHFEYTSDSYDWRVAVSKRGYSWAGCEDGDKQAYMWGVAIGNVSTLKRIKECLHHAILRQKYFNCFRFDEAVMKKTLYSLNKYRPEIIIGYANPLYEFARFIGDPVKVRFKPRCVISAAEKMHDFQKEKIKQVFGCGVFNTYGSREFMLMASECGKCRGMHINMENVLLEVLDENGEPARPGEMGDIVVTDLHNYGMPFIRYRIGDIGVMADDQNCPCGRELPVLKDVVGRSLDMIVTPDGRRIPGEFFPHLMKEFDEIGRFQVVQEKAESLGIKMVKRKELPDHRLNYLRKEINSVVGEGVRVDFDFVEDIPLTKTGKLRVVSSKPALKERSGRYTDEYRACSR